jgi:hypothetical protein
MEEISGEVHAPTVARTRRCTCTENKKCIENRVSPEESGEAAKLLKGNGVATLAQNKIFPTKQELLLSEITGLPLDAQMQRNRLDVDERVEGSRQCSCSRPS